MQRRGNLFTKLVLLFTIVPLIELYILFEMAKVTSWGYTIMLVIATGVIGAYMAKKEGRYILSRIQNELNVGRMPGEELINGLCVLVGGALLLTPGIITDVLGMSLVFPSTRRIYKNWARDKFKKMLKSGTVNIFYK